VELYSTALQGGPGADSKRRPACCIQEDAMTHIPPPPTGIVALLLLLIGVLAFVAYEVAAW
jgi:hypothetical protein